MLLIHRWNRVKVAPAGAERATSGLDKQPVSSSPETRRQQQQTACSEMEKEGSRLFNNVVADRHELHSRCFRFANDELRNSISNHKCSSHSSVLRLLPNQRQFLQAACSQSHK